MDLALLIVAVFQILIENNHFVDVEIGFLSENEAKMGKNHTMEKIFKIIFPT